MPPALPCYPSRLPAPTTPQVGRRQRCRCDSRTTLCIQSTGQSCEEAAGSNTVLTSLSGRLECAAAGGAGQPLLGCMFDQHMDCAELAMAHPVNVPVLTSIDPRGPQDFMGMLLGD